VSQIAVGHLQTRTYGYDRPYLFRFACRAHLALQEKIARSLFAFEQYLAASFYGKFFARNLNLHLLQRKPEDWRNLQSQYKLASSQAIKPIPTEASYVTAVPLAPPIDKPQKRKRNTTDNEIDALFHASLGRKIKKGVLEAEPKASSAVDGFQDGHTTASLPVDDRGLIDVLEAIRVAPKDEKGGKRKKKRVH
jgi:nucleolar protein 9